MHISALWFLLSAISFSLFSVSLSSDARATLASLYCGPPRPSPSDFISKFVKEMEFLSQILTRQNFGTHHLNTTPPIYSLAQCFNDLSQTDCLLCYASSRTILPRCLPSPTARIYLDGCFLRYDNYSFFHESVDPVRDSVNCSDGSGVYANSEVGFKKSVDLVLENVTRNATGDGGFGVGENDGVFALAQCWETVGADGCRECLEKAKMGVRRCVPKREGRAMFTGCYLRYSTTKFYNDGEEESDDNGLSTGVIVAIVLSALAFVLLSLFAAYAVYAKLSKIKRERRNLGKITVSFNKSSLNFKYETLEKATDYFSPCKKIGQGGNGSVFMGVLPSGETVAVKRLVFNTRQWVDEFFNEVNLISGIKHKNLVRLLGCSIEGPESLLVYEYVANRSLDQFIFDRDKDQILSWKQRFDIIVGTAEGLAYLHGGQIRIIHRDIKSSNVLLDENLTPKIADFGLARCFGADKSHLSTGIAGTLGYMAPEYLVRGQLTEKADVYSFGVLVLEIVCGRRNSAFAQDSGSLLQTVWKLYKSENLAEAVDPSLENEFPIQVAANVLQVGLLCTQASATLRPSMAQVVSMLTNKECQIPIPNQPPFLSSSVLDPTSSTRSYSTTSLVSNAATRFEAFDTSSESTSMQSRVVLNKVPDNFRTAALQPY